MSNMVVNTNVLALNSHRALKNVGTMQSESSNRLSTGLRINSAADDAAGLAISEKMRAQIRGLDQASSNSQDGISFVQTAEGGMQEIDNMVQRMRELTVQAANDSNDYDSGDRANIQKEIDQLVDEIDSMSERVEFNKKTLLDGSQDVADYDSAYNNALKAQGDQANFEGSNYYDALGNMASGTLNRTSIGSDTDGELSAKFTELFTEGNLDIEKFQGSSQTGVDFNLGGASVTLGDSTTTNSITYSNIVTAMKNSDALEDGDANKLTDDSMAALSSFLDDFMADDQVQSAMDTALQASGGIISGVTLGTATFDDVLNDLDSLKNNLAAGEGLTDINYTKGGDASSQDGPWETSAGVDLSFVKVAEGLGLITDGADTSASIVSTEAADKFASAESSKTGEGIYLQIGANSGQGLNFSIGALNSTSLGLSKDKANSLVDGYTSSGINVNLDDGAKISEQLDTLDRALTTITSERAKLGAVQNRLEYTGKSLDIASENLSASESRIRDTDMAKEMMNMTKANVLQQAATSMLSQANQAPQNVLQLLG